MISRRVRPLVGGTDLAWAYAAVVAVVAVVAQVLPGTSEELVLDTSTNLDNLRHTPVLVLVASAFVVSSLRGLWILLPLVVVFGAAQRWLGRAATLVVATLGHVGATLLVAVLLAAGIERGALDPAIARAPDVGVSYGLAAVAGVLVARVPRRRRPWYALALLVVAGGPLLVSPNFTDVGHLIAVLLGFAVALVVQRAGAPERSAGPPVAVTDLLSLASSRFVSITTFRPSGEPVAVPVWLVRDGDELLVLTAADTGKVRRVRTDPRVQLRPCNRRGAVPPGVDPVPGKAEVDADPARVLPLLRAKYGPEYRIVTAVERLLRRPAPAERVLLRITPA